MSKQISQDTFNEVVKENIEIFDMSLSDAILDAKKQFEAQNVNLYNIIIDDTMFSVENGSVQIKDHPVIFVINSLKDLDYNNLDVTALENNLKTLDGYFKEDISYRLMAAKNNFTEVLLTIINNFNFEDNIFANVLSTTVLYITDQPDEITKEYFLKMIDILKSNTSDNEINANIFKLLTVCCIKHEGNKVTLVNDPLSVIETAINILKKDGSNCRNLVRNICMFLKVLTLDDDIRVPCGNGMEHAKIIVAETESLDILLNLCKTYKSREDEVTVSEIFSTLDKLSVRDEFCQRILEMGGLDHIFEILGNHLNSAKVVVASFGLLKSLSGNDKVKAEVGKGNRLDLTLKALKMHVKHQKTCVNGCGTLASVSLRQEANAEKLILLGVADLLKQIIQVHVQSKSFNVLRAACLTVRNIVSRSPHLKPVFLELDFETILNEVLHLSKDCDDEAKAALRDLDCAVELKELWTGRNNGIKK